MTIYDDIYIYINIYIYICIYIYISEDPRVPQSEVLWSRRRCAPEGVADFVRRLRASKFVGLV